MTPHDPADAGGPRAAAVPALARSTRARRVAALLLPLLAAACRTGDPDATEGLGTLELDASDVAPLVTARVVEVRAAEGDDVRAGDTLAVLARPGQADEVDAARDAAAAAEAVAGDLAAGARAPELARLVDELRAAGAEAERLERDAGRAEALLAAGAIAEQEAARARTAATVAAARRDAAAETLRLARAGARAGELRGARARADAADAAARAAASAADALVLRAPVQGRVLGLHAQAGEVLAAGEPVYTVGDPRRPWTRVYLSQRALPGVRVGGRAEGRLDAFPDRRFAGRVVAVADRAEFTPRVALTERERDDLLFAVKVAFDDTTGQLKAGLPVKVRLVPDSATPARAGERRP